MRLRVISATLGRPTSKRRLTTNETAIVAAGAGALQILAGELRIEANRRPSESALWRSVCDVEGLAARLEDQREADFPLILLGGENLHVMDDVSSGEMEARYALRARLSARLPNRLRSAAP